MAQVTQAIILVGGKGTRLRPLTTNVPKPVLEVVDRPFLGHMLDWLAGHGITDAVLCCGFRSELVSERLGDGSDYGVRLTYVTEPEPRGTAGALKFAEEHLEDRFVMVNGDLLTDLDLSAQIAAHEESGCRCTLGLVSVDDPSAFGLVRTAPDGSVIGFLEKPKPEEIDTDLISAGCYVLERSVVDMIPEGQEFSIERQVFPELIGHGLAGVPHRGSYFMDLGTPERYLDGVRDILTGKLPTRSHKLLDGSGRHLDPTARVEGTVGRPAWIGPGATVEAGARIGPNTVVGAGAVVGEGASVSDSVVLGDARIGAGAQLYRSLVGPRAEVGEGSVIGALAVVGPDAKVPGDTVVEHETKIEAVTA